MQALDYEYTPDEWFLSNPGFVSFSHKNKGRSNISFKMAVDLYNGRSVKCVFNKPPKKLCLWSFDDYSLAKAKAARILNSVKLQYCKKTKTIICQDHRVSFTTPSYAKLFLDNKYF
jgi:hypothetical protein